MTATDRSPLRAIRSSAESAGPGRTTHPAPRRGLAGRSSVARCPRCGQPVVRCRTTIGTVVAVDPRPVAGGELLINPATDRIVAVRNRREALHARRNGDAGFVPHERICAGRREHAGPVPDRSCVDRTAS